MGAPRHNDRMRLPRRPSGLPGRLVGLTAALVLVLTGCGGNGENPDGDADPTDTPTAEPYLPVPDGVELTPQGSELAVGDTGTVAFELSQGKVGALEITVTSLEKASFDLFVGWELTKDIRKTAPYFVRAKVTNVGENDLGKRPVPLYAVDGENRLIESSLFTGSFKPCDDASFPKGFKTGDTLKACMVYLAPGNGDLTAASFRPSQEFDPIVWTGELVPADDGKGKRDGQGRRGQNDGQNDGQGRGDQGDD
jgi:hypothetical protein